MLYTLPTHIIQMQTPLCADIMSYYKKKIPAAGFTNPTSKRHRSLYAIHETLRTLSGRLQSMRARLAHSNVSIDEPQDMIHCTSTLKPHIVHFALFTTFTT